MKISPAKALTGRVDLPGDKSISHRAALLAAIADGETNIENFASSADCASTLACLRALAVKIERTGSSVRIKGAGKYGLVEPRGPLNCGNSGTTMRLLSGILAGQPFSSTLTGDESLSSRPMNRVFEPLGLMGAKISSDHGRAPFTIEGRNPLEPIEYQPPISSAQIKSCVLLAGLYAQGVTTLVEKTPTRDHTERMLDWLRVKIGRVDKDGTSRISVFGDARPIARDMIIPADISAAAFFLVAAAGIRGSDLVLPNVGLNGSRRAIVDVLISLGVDIVESDKTDLCNEPVGTLRVKSSAATDPNSERPVIKGKVIANLIDELPVLAVLGTQLPNGLEIRDALELRVKETDRISAVAENLKRMNARVTELEDGLIVERSSLRGATVDSFGDHRIAMSFAIAGLFAEGETTIVGHEAVNVSFPGFFEILESVVSSDR